MVDSRQKGARAELQARDLLIKYTGLNWQRVPGSGALDEKHGLKGDLYIPNEKNVYCVEVKHYAEDQINTKLLTGKSPQFLDWWEQTVRQANQVEREPMLLFKHNRSKWFFACTLYTWEMATFKTLVFKYQTTEIFMGQLEDLLKTEVIEWIK